MTKWMTKIIEPDTVNALAKSRNDLATVAHEMGYEYLYIKRYSRSQIKETLAELNARIAGILAGVKENDLVVYQYPAYIDNQFESNIEEQVIARNAHFVPFVHDAEQIRFGFAGGFNEIDYFNKATAIVVANRETKAELERLGVRRPMILQHIWDYLTDSPIISTPLKREIVMAGSFIKSDVLSSWHQQTHLIAFGQMNNQIPAANVDYRGTYAQQELFSKLPPAFGLAWDTGDNYGKYTRYNNPHKVGLYMAAGLPVIVWKESGIADFIANNKLGYLISSLDDIDSLLDSLSNEEIWQRQKQVQKFANLVRHGFFTKRFLLELEGKITFNDIALS